MDKITMEYLATTYKQDIKPPYDLLLNHMGLMHFVIFPNTWEATFISQTYVQC